MNSIISVITILIFSVFTFSGTSQAVTFLWKDGKGAHIYKCNRYCGKVRVKQTSKGEFRIYSIPYSGDIKAFSEKQAAMKACKEIDMGQSEQAGSSSNRAEYGCK